MLETVKDYLEARDIAQDYRTECREEHYIDIDCPELDASRAWNKALIEKYPFLAVNDWHGFRVEGDYDYTQLDDMPDGWYIAFGLQMVEEIAQELDCAGIARADYHVVQVKEKFGGLRWYDNGNNTAIQQIIDKYEDLSYTTCCKCGAPAEYQSMGWICPYCKECATNICRDHDERYPKSAPHKLEDSFCRIDSEEDDLC